VHATGASKYCINTFCRSILLTTAFFCALFSSSSLIAENTIRPPRPAVEEIITIGVRERRLAELPRSATVITAEDIALQPSTNIVDLLSREANLNLRSVSGNDKFSGVDIRGQGDTYSSNVLVMVDGVRLNAADLSGADFSSVPLEQIERVEVIRGANAVRYGNGAVGGIVNIVTKPAGPGGNVRGKLRTGSFATVEAGLGGAWNGDIYSVSADAAYFDTDGYRENSGLEKKDISLSAGVAPTDWFDASVTAKWHRDNYELPGPVSADDFFNGSEADRRAASTPLDGGRTEDDRLRADVVLGNVAIGKLTATLSTRERNNEYLFSGGIGGLRDTVTALPDTIPDEISEEDDRLELQYDKTVQMFGLEHEFFVGLNLADVDYARIENNIDPALPNIPDFSDISTAKQGNIRQRAWFAAADITLSEPLKLSLGYRQDSFDLDGKTVSSEYTCPEENQTTNIFGGVVCDFGAPRYIEDTVVSADENSWRNSAAEAGLVYSYSDTGSVFLSFARSFRNPNVDELIFSDDDLGPQTGKHLDAGWRQTFADSVEFSLAGFLARTDDEILFGLDPVTDVPVNRNAEEPVRRVGGETDARWFVSRSLTLTANIGYTDATFTKTNTKVPLVPEFTGALGLQWQPLPAWILSATGNYVGSRYDGNDFSNSEDKLSAYQVVNSKLIFERSGFQAYAGVDNLFDEVYAASAYSQRYYPMPGRNYYVGLGYRFN